MAVLHRLRPYQFLPLLGRIAHHREEGCMNETFTLAEALAQIDRLCEQAAQEQPDKATLHGLISDVQWVIAHAHEPEPPK